MSKAREHDDYDTPWKEILEKYFQEFIAFFFPHAYEDIDWGRRYELLDKELQQITRDAVSKRRYVDKLIGVWLKSGHELRALVHSDIQMQWEGDFDRRIFIYNYRIFDRFGIYAASFVIFSGEERKQHPGVFEQTRWKTRTRFEFPVVRLADFHGREDELEQDTNPFAIVVLAHLSTRKTSGGKGGRLREKISIIRHLYQKGFSKKRVVNLFRFIDWMMRLPEEEENLFWDEVKKLEEEKNMPYVTTGERIGYKRGVLVGRQEGRQEGRLEERIALFSQLISQKFNVPAEKVSALLRSMGSERLSELTSLFYTLDSFDAFRKWAGTQGKGETGQ